MMENGVTQLTYDLPMDSISSQVNMVSVWIMQMSSGVYVIISVVCCFISSFTYLLGKYLTNYNVSKYLRFDGEIFKSQRF